MDQGSGKQVLARINGHLCQGLIAMAEDDLVKLNRLYGVALVEVDDPFGVVGVSLNLSDGCVEDDILEQIEFFAIFLHELLELMLP